MVELVPKMAAEAPDDYVSFVDRHLAALRSESARLAGDAWRAEEIYPEVLTSVAARWRWLDLLATRFGRAAAADDYLRRMLAERAQRWRAEQIYEVDMVVLRADPADPVVSDPGGPPGPAGRMSPRSGVGLPAGSGVGGSAGPGVGLPRFAGTVPAGSGGGLPPAPFAGPMPAAASAGLARYRRTGPGRSSVGLRQARFLGPQRRPPAPIAEAAIAWWHAYVAQRRRKRVAAVIALILLVAALANLRATNRI